MADPMLEFTRHGHEYRVVFVPKKDELAVLDIMQGKLTCVDQLAELIEKEHAQATSPEGLASAILKKGKHLLDEAMIYKDNKLNDGLNGEPAYQKFENGAVVHSTRFTDGERTLAQDFNQKGKSICNVRFTDDYPNNGPKSEPAVEIFDDAGQRTYLEYQTHGKRHTGPDGEPARQWFENGQLAKAVRYEEDELTGKLNEEELAELQKLHPKQTRGQKAKALRHNRRH